MPPFTWYPIPVTYQLFAVLLHLPLILLLVMVLPWFLITHFGHSTIPTSICRLFLQSILVTPRLIINLAFVHKFTTDSNCNVEFDPHVFSVKDLSTKSEILRCNSLGEVYPLYAMTPHALVTSTDSTTLGIIVSVTLVVMPFIVLRAPPIFL